MTQITIINHRKLRISCPQITQRQFAAIIGHIESVQGIGIDTYPYFAGNSAIVTFDGIHPEELRDMIDEQVIGKFTSRCCNPSSPLFIQHLADTSPATESELLAIAFPEDNQPEKTSASELARLPYAQSRLIRIAYREAKEAIGKLADKLEKADCELGHEAGSLLDDHLAACEILESLKRLGIAKAV